MNTSTQLPMVRLSLLAPIARGAQQRGVAIEEVFAVHCLSSTHLEDPELFVPAKIMYALVEGLSEATKDPFFGVRAGERLDPWSWPPLARAAAGAVTVGDFLVRFCLEATEEASSISYAVEAVGKRTTFLGRRASEAGIRPRHNDGFSIAYMLRILSAAVGSAWDGRRVLARVSDPRVIPPDYLGIRVATANVLGFSIDFPTRWMLLKPSLGAQPRSNTPTVRQQLPLTSPQAALRHALLIHLHEASLDAAHVAALFGISKRTLARRLTAEGTTLGAELNALRKERAQHLLRSPKITIAQVGADVGYPDPAVFSRAFRRWTGQSPSEFRRSLGQG